MKIVKRLGNHTVYEYRDKYLMRYSQGDIVNWKVYAKYKDEMLKDFLFSTNNVGALMHLIAFFDENIVVPIIEEAYPTHVFNSNTE